MWNSKEASNYGANMQKVGEFHDLWSFWQNWSNLPHSDPRFFFSDQIKNEEKVPEGMSNSIESIGIFEDSIRPEWEDPQNKSGCDFFSRIPFEQDMKGIWEKTVFALIGETLPSSEEVTGVRIVDRGKFFKIEVWVRFNSDNKKIAQMKERLAKEFELGEPNQIEIAHHEEKHKKIAS